MKHFAKSMMLLFALSTINLFWFQPIHASNGILEKEAQQALKDVVNDIKLKVQSYWSAGDAYPGYVVTINIVVGPRGDVISANVVDGSGDSSFDKLAIKTLFDSSPLPFPQNPKYYNYINSFNFVFRGSTISGSSKPIGERATEDSQTKQPVTNNRPTVAKSHSNDLINRVGVGAAITYIFTALIVLYVFFYSYKKIIRSRKAPFTMVNNLIEKAYLELNADAYFSHEMMSQWLRDYDQLRFLQNLNKKKFEYAALPNQALECRKVFTDVETYRRDRNDRWVGEELSKRKELFDSLEKYPLTGNQRQAIVRNDNRVLTVAGAGTGKTSTVVGKVAHLLTSGWCEPSEILLMSFSRETVGELRERISKIESDGVDIRTFHALGLNVIKTATGEDVDVLERIPVHRYLKEMLHSNSTSQQLLEYIIYHYFPTKYEDEFTTTKEYNEFATNHNLRTLQNSSNEKLITLQREKVRSNQEVQIANWLYTNKIKYVYEQQYSKYSGRYKPDFYLPDFEIYIEHFGINRDGATRKDIDPQKYNEEMQWKRNLHKTNKTTLVETFSYQFKEGNAFELLEKSLALYDVVTDPMTLDELRKIQAIHEDLKDLAKMTETFLSLFKSDYITMDELMERYPEDKYPRENLYLRLFSTILERYESDLIESGKIDFGDMIVKATRSIEANQFNHSYKVIIVDEYQDITKSRAMLIDALQKQYPDLRILSVGDDWQSIYRFTGSDVSLMTNYETQKEAVVRIDLDRTYRHNDKLLEASTKFITQNPTQLKKVIHTDTRTDGPVIHIADITVEDALIQIEQKMKDDEIDGTVLILGRYNFTKGVSYRNNSNQVKGLTAHRSKGLEADYVIVNEMSAGKYGFPSQLREDPIISTLLADSEEFPNSEERRLFYVAITRAKREVWLLRSNKEPPSEFLVELMTDGVYKGLVESEASDIDTNTTCRKCNSLMQKFPGKDGKSVFFGCIHYPRCDGYRPGCPQCHNGALLRSEEKPLCSNLDCDHVPTECPDCETGILIRRTSDEYDFMGCSNYPDCRYTQQIN